MWTLVLTSRMFHQDVRVQAIGIEEHLQTLVTLGALCLE
jgi:hypothetical protein